MPNCRDGDANSRFRELVSLLGEAYLRLRAFQAASIPTTSKIVLNSPATCLEVAPDPRLSVPAGYDRSAHQREEPR